MFTQTRFRLTAWYLLIIMTVSLSFSFVVHRLLSREIDRFALVSQFRFERQLSMGILIRPNTPANIQELKVIFDPDLIGDIKRRLFFTLVAVNGIIFVVSGVLGFMLAGKTLSPIAAMVEEQNRFISDASHQLRTPITALKTLIEVALRDKNMRLRDAKLVIKDSLYDVNNLHRLSNELLEFSRYQNSSQISNYSTVKIKDIINNAVKNISAQAKAKNMEIVYDYHDFKLTTWAAGINDVLTIFLDNAIKYSPVQSEIKITARQDKDSINISVRDQGAGILENDIPYIFNRFYKAGTSYNTPESKSFGLGLSIAKRISILLGGKITVDSKINKGSNFTIIIPKISHEVFKADSTT